MKNLPFCGLALICLSLLVWVQPACLAEDGSLESMWMDQPAPPSGKDEDASLTVAALTPPVAASSTAAPMCSLEDFKGSQFIAKGSWPGVGPFTFAASGEFADAAQNVIKLEAVGNQITRAELSMAPGSATTGRDFLDIEMTADFLLEALGAKPAKIAEFNGELEKNRERIMAAKGGQSFSAGRYQMTIDRSFRANNGCLLVVNSLDASKAVLKEHSVKPDPPKVAKVSHLPPVSVPSQPVRKTAPTAAAAINPSIDPRRDEFANVIRAWQNLKKGAVRKHETAQLGDVLAGRALARQTDAVKWLATNKKYYDMNPRGVVVDKYQEQVPGKKFLVLAQVREFSKFIDEPTGQVLKEVDDKYTVNYTIEKIGDRWMITDSALLSSGPQLKTPAKPSR